MSEISLATSDDRELPPVHHYDIKQLKTYVFAVLISP